VEQPGGTALEIRRRPGVEAKASAERGARGRGFAPPHPGGPGGPSAPTMGGCLQWLDAVATKAGRKPAGSGSHEAPVAARKHGSRDRNRRKWSAGWRARLASARRPKGGHVKRHSALHPLAFSRGALQRRKGKSTRACPGPTSRTRAMKHACAIPDSIMHRAHFSVRPRGGGDPAQSFQTERVRHGHSALDSRLRGNERVERGLAPQGDGSNAGTHGSNAQRHHPATRNRL